jgi:HEAT repeat protein
MIARRLLAISLLGVAVWAMYAGRSGAAGTNEKPTPNKSLVGTRLRHSVSYQSSGYTELRAVVGVAPGSEAPPRHNLFGSLQATEILTFVELDRTIVRASVRFENPLIKIQIDSKSQPEREHEVAESLEHPAAVYFDAQSRITRLEFPKEYSPMASNFVKAVVTLQQFVVPAGRNPKTWNTVEIGTNGRYAAHYQVAGTSGQIKRVTKTLAKSPHGSATEGPDSLTTAQVMPQGTIQISVSMDQGTVQDLEGVSHEDVLIQGHVLASQDTTVSSHIISSVRLSQEDVNAALRALPTSNGARNALNRPEKGLTPDRERAMQQQVLGTDSAQSLLSALSEIDSGSVSREGQMNVYLKLKALVYLHPEASRTLGNRLAVADPKNPSAEMITTALSAVASPEAQDALCAVIRSTRDDVQSLTRLVPALGSLPQPTEQVVALLQQLSHSSSGDVRSMALLALGGAAKNLAHVSNKRSTAIVSDLAGQLTASQVGDEKTTLLLALGNSGTAQAENIILSQRNDKSTEMRRVAVTALGDFQSDATLRALCDALKADPESQVRSAAAQSLAPRSSAKLAKDALLQAAQQDVAESVRLASVFALTALIPRDVHVREVVNAIAENDTSEGVRKQAASLLLKNQTPQ